MKTRTCYICDGTVHEHRGTLPFKNRICGTIEVPNVHFEKCDQCGEVLLFPNGAPLLSRYAEAEEQRRIATLPAGDFIPAKEAAVILGITIAAFCKHRRIQRGFIHQINMGGHKLYNRRSVEMFKNAGDGRFPIESRIIDNRKLSSYKKTPVIWINPNRQKPEPASKETVYA